MKKMMHILYLLPLMLLVMLTGCSLHSDDDLYHIPELPATFQNLTSQISSITDKGAEYCAPLSGENIQNIQLQDLDGDGVVDSAITFFRMSGEENPLKIYIYHEYEGLYELAAVIEGAGTAINYVDYVNLDDKPDKEIVVSWQYSDKLHFLDAYSVSGGQVVEMLHTDYTLFKVFDMDRNNDQEIIVINEQTDGSKQIHLYDCKDGLMELDSTAEISRYAIPQGDAAQTGTSLKESDVRRSYLKDLVPAIYVTSDLFSENNNFRYTDIFVWEAGQGRGSKKELRNVTLDPDEGYSASTVGNYAVVGPMDINKDSILELPSSVEIKEYKPTGTVPNFWLNKWNQYDIDGNPNYVYTTYYNDRDGWYLELPDEWNDKITLSRSDAAGGGERAVIFSYWDKESGNEPVPFLTIYRLAGSNRMSWANLPGRFRLGDSGEENPSILYAGRFESGAWDCGLNEQTLREKFHVIRADWGSSD